MIATRSGDGLKLLARPQLSARLRAAVADFPLTAVAAPLGAGKSVALARAFDADARCAWLTLEPWHRGVAAAALVEAIRTVRPDFGRATLGALEGGMPPAALALQFAADLGHLRDPLLIIVDNADALWDDSQLAGFLPALARALPAPVRLVLSGRARPEGELLDAFASGRATLVGNDAFRFDEAEIVALAEQLGRPLDIAGAKTIVAATDGWATAVVLALTTRGDGVPGLRSLHSAAAYVERALLPALQPAAVAFLEAVSVIETLDVAVLERLPVFARARSTLAELERDGALVSELSVPGRYRVHPILRAVARARLDARRGASAAHATAAEAFIGANAISAALYHALEAADPHVAARFLRAHAMAAVGTGDRVRVRALAALIDRAGADGDVAAFVEGLDEKATGSPNARASFSHARRAAEASGDPAIAFFARAQIIEYDLGRLNRVDPDELSALCERAEELGPAALSTAEMLSGWASAIAFDFRGAHDRIAPITRFGDAGAQFNTRILYAYVQTALGAFSAAQNTLDGLIRLLENDDRIVLQMLALVWFARLALTWGAINAAADAAGHAHGLASALELHAEEGALYAALTEIATHRGDARAAAAYAQSARERAPHAWYVADVARLRAFAEIATARVAFIAHDNAIARNIALRAAEVANIPSPLRALALAEAAVYTLLCEPRAAAAALAQARAATRLAEPLDVGDAATLTAAGDVLAFLAAANGEDGGVAYPLPGPFDAFVAQRRGLATLELAGIAVGNARRGQGSAAAVALALERLARDGPRFEARLARAYASRFVKAPEPPPHRPAAIDLTKREREILRLLVDGLTNKEIALRIVVSPRTVETHVERVLSKLEVGSRSRAIAKAFRLGLVDLDA